MSDELGPVSSQLRPSNRMLPSFLAVKIGQADVTGVVKKDGYGLPPVRTTTVEPSPRTIHGERVPEELVNPEENCASADFHPWSSNDGTSSKGHPSSLRSAIGTSHRRFGIILG